MAAPKKKRGVEEMEIPENVEEDDDDIDDDEYEDDDGEDSEEDMLVNQNVQVEFEARNAEDSDFHGIKKLLQQVYLKANINLSELTDTIISQNYIGSVIKQPFMSEEESDDDDDDDVFGIVTAVNITERKELECVQQLQSFLLDKCAAHSKETRDQLAAVLHHPDSQVALLVNERFINIPPQIALPTFESLLKEMERAVKKKMKYEFSHFLMVTKTYRLPGAGGKGSQADMRTFINAEEELFQQESVLSFDYSVASERDTCVGGQWDDDEEEYEPIRTVLLLPKPRLPAVMDRMRDMLALPPGS